MKALLAPMLVILALVPAAVPLSAHHSWPVNTARLITVKGTVVELAWENPHPMITLEVRPCPITHPGEHYHHVAALLLPVPHRAHCAHDDLATARLVRGVPPER